MIVTTGKAATAAPARAPFVETDISTWTETDYERLLAEANSLMNADSEPRLGRLVHLGELIEAYETIHYPMPEPSPEAIELYERERRGEVVDWDSIPIPVIPEPGVP